VVARDGVEPPTPAFSATLCSVLNNLSDFRCPPKYLRSRERHANRGSKSWVQKQAQKAPQPRGRILQQCNISLQCVFSVQDSTSRWKSSAPGVDDFECSIVSGQREIPQCLRKQSQPSSWAKNRVVYLCDGKLFIAVYLFPKVYFWENAAQSLTRTSSVSVYKLSRRESEPSHSQRAKWVILQH
jgi:hypothetical protein